MEMSHEQALAHRDAYVAALPRLVQQLREHTARTGGPSLDGSVDSLAELGPWFVARLDADTDDDTDDGFDESPLWWDAQQPLPDRDPITDRPTRYLSPRQLRLVDEVAAYLGTVLQTAVPQARWIVYRQKSRGRARDINHHATMLQGPWAHGSAEVDPVGIVYSQALAQHMYQRGQDPDLLHDFALSVVGTGPGGGPGGH